MKGRTLILKRSILLFPEFENVELIESIREKYDPLYKLIRPHITLVFPFESELTQKQIEEHIRYQLKDIKPFKIELREITGTNDNYLFLNVKKGNDEIIRIHDLLYTNILEPYRDRRYTYTPHITLGRFSNKPALTKAVSRYKDFDHLFKTVINEVNVEIIDKQENSQIESKVLLKS